MPREKRWKAEGIGTLGEPFSASLPDALVCWASFFMVVAGQSLGGPRATQCSFLEKVGLLQTLPSQHFWSGLLTD